MKCTICNKYYKRVFSWVEKNFGRCIECLRQEVLTLDENSILYKYIILLEESCPDFYQDLEERSDYDSEDEEKQKTKQLSEMEKFFEKEEIKKENLKKRNQMWADLIKKADKLSQKKLSDLLAELATAYYHGEDPDEMIPDSIYDKMVEIYEDRFKMKYERSGASPSRDRVQLPYYMGSLSKITDEKALSNWVKKYPKSKFIIEDKIDGQSSLLIHRNDKSELYTKGDADKGDGMKISHLVPLLQFPFLEKNCEVRSEFAYTKKEFATFQQADPNIKASRNMVAGVTNSKHYSIDKVKKNRYSIVSNYEF